MAMLHAYNEAMLVPLFTIVKERYTIRSMLLRTVSGGVGDAMDRGSTRKHEAHVTKLATCSLQLHHDGSARAPH